MKERIGYIDSLKGLAILLMVMGHVIACQFPSYQYALCEAPRSTMVVWRIIYSFHMPLLMFCSGLFILPRPISTISDLGISLWKRVKSLVFPSIFAGGILWLQRGNFGYWFLWTLFQFIVVALLLHYLCNYIPRYGKHVYGVLLCIISIVIMLFLSHLIPYQNLPLLDIEHWNQFPYFSMGVICAQYDLCDKWFSRNWVYTCALLLFGFLSYWITIEGNHIPKQTVTGCLLPISAIVSLVYLFKMGLSGDSKVEMRLRKLGTHSLEVYILHLFFLPKMYPIGEYVLKLANTGEAQTIFFVQFVTSLMVSVIIIYMCYMIMNVINKSVVLSQLLLGRKSEIDAK